METLKTLFLLDISEASIHITTHVDSTFVRKLDLHSIDFDNHRFVTFYCLDAHDKLPIRRRGSEENMRLDARETEQKLTRAVTHDQASVERWT